jgi:hypothetical protein
MTKIEELVKELESGNRPWTNEYVRHLALKALEALPELRAVLELLREIVEIRHADDCIKEATLRFAGGDLSVMQERARMRQEFMRELDELAGDES